MGYRAMRMRFLDLEPEEIFANAKKGDARCREFVDLWHRALAAATASFIHLAGPGRFYFTGHNVGFLELPLLRSHLETMVKMSPLLSFSLEDPARRRRHRPARRRRKRHSCPGILVS